MGNVIAVAPGQLGAVLKTDAAKLPQAVKRAMLKGAQRGRALLVKLSPVDRGILKNAWRIVKLSSEGENGCEVVNDSPHAGVVERGARPGMKMGPAAIESLTGWVKRVILRTSRPKRGKKAASFADWDAEARSIAYAIARKFEREGMKGRFFVKDALPQLTQWVAETVISEITKYYAKGGGTAYVKAGGSYYKRGGR